MHGVEGLAARLSIQVVGLEEDVVVGEAADVDAAVDLVLELHALANVKTSFLGAVAPLDVGQCAQAEAVLARRIKETVDHY